MGFILMRRILVVISFFLDIQNKHFKRYVTLGY